MDGEYVRIVTHKHNLYEVQLAGPWPPPGFSYPTLGEFTQKKWAHIFAEAVSSELGVPQERKTGV